MFHLALLWLLGNELNMGGGFWTIWWFAAIFYVLNVIIDFFTKD